MNQAHANLMVAVVDQVVWIKIKGRADFASSLDLKKLINELWERGYSRYVFELAECLMMDSTFLGVLSGIGLKFCATSNGDNSALELMIRTRALPKSWTAWAWRICSKCNRPRRRRQVRAAAARAGTTQADLVRNCLEAHRTLMAINADNARKFKDVAQFLAGGPKRKEILRGCQRRAGRVQRRQAVNGYYPFRFRMRSKSSVGSISIRPDSAPAGFAGPTPA